MSMNLFRPILGTDEKILNCPYQDGSVYFATDSKKIYLDANDQNKLSMGGNSSIFYGILTVPEDLPEGQTQFEFNVYDIEGNDANHLNIPDKDDLIVNKDGCFYRVVSVTGEGYNSIINTIRLTVAGGGNGDNPSGNVAGDIIWEQLTESTVITLRGYDYSIGFTAYSVDANETPIKSDGTYDIYVNSIPVANGMIKQREKIYVPVHAYLNQDKNTVRVQITMNTGGSAPKTEYFDYNISVTDMNLIWDYDYTNPSNLNYVDEIFETPYKVEGTGIEKTTYVQINNLPPIKLGTTTSEGVQYLRLTPEEISAYGLNHGSHVFKMWAETSINGNNATPPIYKNIAFIGYDEDGNVNAAPIINCGLFDINLTQHTTVNIPINIYSSNNIAGNAVVVLFEDGIEKDRWKDIENFKEYIWSYTPKNSGLHSLKIQCGVSEVVFTINVAELNIGKDEITGYAFKFDASEFASNSAVKNWNSNGVTAEFNNFDWVNGGLTPVEDKDEYGNPRNYLAIKAGSSMSINYKLWEKNAPAYGKVFKIIFKATNCRDYDARILSCKKDKKVINEDFYSEYYFYIEDFVTVSEYLDMSDDGILSLREPQLLEFDLTDKVKRESLHNKYAEIEGNIYRCIIMEDNENSTPEQKAYYASWRLVNVIDAYEGIVLNAQSAQFGTNNRSLDTQYCEDTYIELELSITKNDQAGIKNYIKFWIDGVPSNYTIYNSSTDSFDNAKDEIITIGSDDCDVYLYMMKVYEHELTTEEHLTNFILDASNAEEMLRRHKRNDILGGREIIDPVRLSKANPDCLVHVYDIPRMSMKKSDPIPGCQYSQYHNSEQPVLRAENVMIKVQGTSSEAYVVAAANLDTDFDYQDTAAQYPPSGLIDTTVIPNKVLTDGWKMSENAKGIKYTCTKVNVASCENANNALNQEWYNLFQPYQSVWRCKNPSNRDTMEFTNGVMFIADHQDKYDTSYGAVLERNNVFGEFGPIYWENPYPRMYSLAQMGNSKDNTHVFHDQENPLECCVEVKDNQELQQQMISDQYNKDDIGKGQGFFEFRYPKKKYNQQMVDGWNRLVSWMAHSNPQPKYEKHIATSEKEFKKVSTNLKTQQPIPVYVLNESGNDYILIEQFNPEINDYYTKTINLYGYTGLPLNEYTLSFDMCIEKDGNTGIDKQYYEKNGDEYTPIDNTLVINPAEQQLYEKTKKDFSSYQFTGYRCEEQINPETGKMWQENYEPMVTKIATNDYVGTYTHDTYEYRMAKMLYECENYLVMDSILYHYLFIERHSMIDNVAKNTFWSTEDCKHWNLIKDYDNDTSDGNDNNGKLSIPYGKEAMDRLGGATHVFNAKNSVWFNFIYGLHDACQQMYKNLSSKTVKYKGRTLSIWNHSDYLWLFNQWQSVIPERCWIEDYYRKYFRPWELYKETFFNDMIQGGQKKYQRKQYETYQDIYMSSKYMTNEENELFLRPRGEDVEGVSIPAKTYCDCYVYMKIGSNSSHTRMKRNTIIRCPVPSKFVENATMNVRPGSVITVLGETDGQGQLNQISPDSLIFGDGAKLQKLVFGTNDNYGTLYNQYTTLTEFPVQNPLLEELYVAKMPSVQCDLNLKDAPNLLLLDARESGFKSISIADKAPIHTLRLNAPTALELSNLANLEIFDISNCSNLSSIRFDNIDNDKISSKDIVNQIKKQQFGDMRYTLKNINWVIDNAEEIKDDTILILEYLLNECKPNKNTTTLLDDPTSVALTGTITITSNAYNDNNSEIIYNKYIKEDTYPALDLIFEGTNAHLYNINIYDGDKNIYWARKIAANKQLNNKFLSEGPYGTFNLNGLNKSDTERYDFERTGKWFIYDDKEMSNLIIELDLGKTGIPSYETINNLQIETNIFDSVNSDLYIIPEFSQESRKYTMTFYESDHKTPHVVIENILYGTALKDFIPQEILSKDDSNLPLKASYDFKGYSIIENSDSIVDETFTISGNQGFFPVFERIDDISTIVHPEWFDYEEYTFSHSEISHEDVQGYRVTPKYLLRGKVTIPKEYNNKPIISLDLNSKREKAKLYDDPSEITHIFFENESNILEIVDSTVGNQYGDNIDGLLKYCDLPDSLIYLGNNVFMRCPYFKLPENENGDFILPDKLQYIGKYCFWFAGEKNPVSTTPGGLKLYVPSSIEGIGYQGLGSIGNSQVPLTIVIGSNEKYSNLDFNIPDLTKISSVDGNETSYEFKKFYSVGNVSFEWYLSRYTNLLFDSKIVPPSTEGYKEDAWYTDYTISDVWDGPILGISLNNKSYSDIN